MSKLIALCAVIIGIAILGPLSIWIICMGEDIVFLLIRIASFLILELGLGTISIIILASHESSGYSGYKTSGYGGYGSSSSSRKEEFPLFRATTIDRGALEDKFGDRVGTLEKVASSGNQRVRDDTGRVVGTIDQSVSTNGVQTIRDGDGRKIGEIKTTLGGDRIIIDREGNKATLRKESAGRTVIEREVGSEEDHKNEEWHKAGYSSSEEYERAQEEEEDEENEDDEEEERRKEEEEE